MGVGRGGGRGRGKTVIFFSACVYMRGLFFTRGRYHTHPLSSSPLELPLASHTLTILHPDFSLQIDLFTNTALSTWKASSTGSTFYPKLSILIVVVLLLTAYLTPYYFHYFYYEQGQNHTTRITHQLHYIASITGNVQLQCPLFY